MNFKEKLYQAWQKKLLSEEQYFKLLRWDSTSESSSIQIFIPEKEQESSSSQESHPTEQPFFWGPAQTEKIDRLPSENQQKTTHLFETFSGSKSDELFENLVQSSSELFHTLTPLEEENMEFLKQTSAPLLPSSSDFSFESLSQKQISSSPRQNTSDLFESFSKKYPSSFGQYDIISPIARGGMGAVYLVKHQKEQKEYALKVISNNYDETALKRFQNEASLVAQLKHPGIVAVHDYGENEGTPYLVMDLIQGNSLAYLLKKNGPFPLKKCLKIVIQICMALDYAHSRGVIHRDLKPDNILLTPAGVPLLVDFGLAKNVQYDQSQKLTQTGQILGTPAYMAPEVISSETQEIGVCTDIYGIGITLYELLTVKLPFSSQNSLNLFHQILNHPPLSPRLYNSAIPPQVESIILKCLQKNPKARYEDVRSLSRDISRYLSDIPIESQNSFSFRTGVVWLWRHWFYIFFILGLLYAWQWNQYYKQSVQTLSQELQQQRQTYEQERQRLEHHLVFDRRNALRLQLERTQQEEQTQQTQQTQYSEQQKLQVEIATLITQKEQFQKQIEHSEKEQKEFLQNIQNRWLNTLLICEESPLQKILLAEEGFPQNMVLQLYQQGLQEEKKGEWRKAREVYKKLEEIAFDLALWKQFSLAFYQFDDQKEAYKLLQKLEETAPKSVFTFQVKATLFFEDQEYSKLQSLLENSKSFSENATYQYFLGLLTCHLLNPKNSQPKLPMYQPEIGKLALSKAVEYAPTNFRYRFAEGVIFYLAEDFEGALRIFYHAHLLQETSMTNAFLGILFSKLKQPEKTREYLQKAIQKEAENELALYYWGQLILNQDKNYKLALDTFEKTYFLFKRRLQSHKYLFPGHQKIIDSLNSDLQLVYSTLLLHSGQWQKSSWLYDDFIKKNVYIQEGLIGSGKILLFQGNAHQAQDYFLQALNTLGAKSLQTLMWSSFLKLKRQEEQRLTRLLVELPKAYPNASTPYYVQSLFFVFREFAQQNSKELQVELEQIDPEERIWLGEMLRYLRKETNIEIVWGLAKNKDLQSKTAFYLGLEKWTQNEEKEAQSWFEKCYEYQAFWLEEFFMAWIALGGATYQK